jgi:hypothetical protein
MLARMSSPYDLSPEPPSRATPPRPPVQAFSPGTLSYAPPTLAPIRHNGRRAVVAMVFIYAIAGLQALQLPLEAWDWAQFNASDAGTLTQAQVDRLELVYAALAGLYALALVGWLIAFLLWQYRAVKNARIVTGDSRSGPGMSVAWWFIPIANLFMPWLVLKDLWARTVRDGSQIAGAFWLLWLGASISGAVSEGMYESAVESFDNDLARTSIYLTALSLLLSIASWLLLGHFLRRVQQVQAPHEYSA